MRKKQFANLDLVVLSGLFWVSPSIETLQCRAGYWCRCLCSASTQSCTWMLKLGWAGSLLVGIPAMTGLHGLIHSGVRSHSITTITVVKSCVQGDKPTVESGD